MKLLRNKISDKRFLRLIEVLITAPIREGNKGDIKNTCGCPQGSIISPILANIYLHHVIDLWFASIKQSHIRGHSELIRYADDMVFTFEVPEEAHRFFKVLPKRLAKYGLEVHTDKTQVLAAGHQCAKQAHSEGLRMPTFNFLGFTCYWGKARKGFWRLKYKSRKERFSAKLKGLRNFLRKNLNAQHPSSLLKTVVRVIRGWINYHNISDNSRMVSAFRQESMRILFKWFNRRGRRRPMSWARFNKIMRAINFPLGGKVISMFPTH